MWRTQLDDLSDEFTVVAWDAPGCGSSSDAPDTFRLPDYADCLAGLVEVLGLGPCHVLGHSWGAAVALELVHRHAAIAASLLLVGAYAGWAGSLPPDEVAQRLRFALTVADLAPGTFEPASMGGVFSDAMAPDRVEELTRIMHEVRPAATRTMAYALAEADLRETLGDIQVPTLILAGGADERSPVGVAQALHEAIPNSTLVVLAGLGHEMYLESPVVFDDAIRSFLRTVR